MISTGNATTALTAARRRKLPITAETIEAEDMAAAVYRASHAPEPQLPEIPTTVVELQQAIVDHGLALHEAAAARNTAGLFLDAVDDHLNRLVRAQVDGWIRALSTEFKALITTVRKAAGQLPADVDSRHLNWADSAVSAPWERAESASIQLDQLVSDRRAMARVVGLDGGRDGALHVVVSFGEPTVEDVLANRWLGELVPVEQQWRELQGQPTSRWVHLARAEAAGHISLALATPGQVIERAQTFGRWQAGSRARTSSSSLGSARATIAAAIRD